MDFFKKVYGLFLPGFYLQCVHYWRFFNTRGRRRHVGAAGRPGARVQHVGHARLGLGQPQQEAPGRLDQRGGRVHVVPGKVVQQRLEHGEDAAEGRRAELGQLAQVARVAQPRLQRALRGVALRLRARRGAPARASLGSEARRRWARGARIHRSHMPAGGLGGRPLFRLRAFMPRPHCTEQARTPRCRLVRLCTGPPHLKTQRMLPTPRQLPAATPALTALKHKRRKVHLQRRELVLQRADERRRDVGEDLRERGRHTRVVRQQLRRTACRLRQRPDLRRPGRQ